MELLPLESHGYQLEHSVPSAYSKSCYPLGFVWKLTVKV